MRRWTFPLGRFFGVDIRIHSFFALMLMLCVSYASIVEVSLGRGFALGLFLLLAVGVREVARAIAGAWFGYTPVALILLPTGALPAYAGQDPEEALPGIPASSEGRPGDAKSSALDRRKLHMARTIAVTGIAANLLFGLTLGALILTVSPQVNLIQTPWIHPAHLLRSLVWVNLLLGAVNLLPAWPLDGSRLFQSTLGGEELRVVPGRISIGTVIAVALIVGGVVAPNMWLMMVGIFVLIFTQMEDQGRSIEGSANTLTMRDVMMEDYTVLSASATLEDAMRHATHTLQDVFPVVRGGNLVGAVSRQHIAEALSSGGNSYVQGIMTRSFRTANPGDPLLKTLRRIMSGPVMSGAQLVPIVESTGADAGERIVGIVTPQNLQRSMSLLDQSRRIRRANEISKEQDEL